MCQKWGVVRQHILANSIFIKKALAEGKSRRIIFDTLSKKGLLKGSYSAFSRQINLIFYSASTAELGPVLSPDQPVLTAPPRPKTPTKTDARPPLPGPPPIRPGDSLSVRMEKVRAIIQQDPETARKRVEAFITPVKKD